MFYTKEEKEDIYEYIFFNKEPKLKSTKIKINALCLLYGLDLKFHWDGSQEGKASV